MATKRGKQLHPFLGAFEIKDEPIKFGASSAQGNLWVGIAVAMNSHLWKS